MPDRFLKEGVRDPNVAFGFGRRVCPGRHMADNSVWIAAASILHTFELSQKGSLPEERYTSGLIMYVLLCFLTSSAADGLLHKATRNRLNARLLRGLLLLKA